MAWPASINGQSRRAPALACVLLAAAACVLGGCGATGGGDASATGPAAHRAADYRAEGPGRSGGTLRISAAADTQSLDLHAISHTNAQWLGRLLFDNLVYLDAEGRPTPWLAKSWEISADGTVYTFHLREDVTFSDGTRFDAEAVRVNLEHMRDPATKSPLAAAYIVPYVDGRVLDDFTFQARLGEPYAPFLEVLAQSWLAIFSPKAIRGNAAGLAQAPVGSGPFVLERYDLQQGIRLVRRADYAWAPQQLGHAGAAYLERIEIDFLPEALVRYSALAAGRYDFTIDAPPQNAAAIRRDPRLAFDIRVRKGNPYRGVAFNATRFPFDDVRVRRALALAVDREGIARITGFGEFEAKADFLAANTRHYDPAYAQALRQDLDAANRLLDQAGWTGRDAEGYRTREGRRLSAELLVNESLSPTPAPVAIQADARRIGLELRLRQLQTLQLLERRRSGDYQAVVAGVWHTNTPDGLYIQYHGSEITSPARIGQNVSRLQDPELDEVLAAARRSQDPEQARVLYSRAQQRLVELVPAIPLYENYSVTARSRRVRGLVYDTSHNTPVFTSVWLDGAGS